jgi:hypothetical protein
VICAVVPLVLTSILAQALMVTLNVGIKVATPPSRSLAPRPTALALQAGFQIHDASANVGVINPELPDGSRQPSAAHLGIKFPNIVDFLHKGGANTPIFNAFFRS